MAHAPPRGEKPDGPRRRGAPVEVVWDPRTVEYRFGPSHPFDERSRALAVDLLEASWVAAEAARYTPVREVVPSPAEDLARFHDRRFLDRVLEASRAGDRRLLDAGDTPSFPGCWDASRRIVASTVRAMRDALEHGTDAFVPGGGLHHASPGRASGFCILNDLAVAIAEATERGHRVAYLDLDVHHGDGVMYGFYGSGRVLDVDFHQDGRTLFPGTGAIRETGAGDGAGLKVNLPLPPGAGDEALIHLAERTVPPLFREFRPDVIVVQHGVDGHWGDPLARLQYTPSGYDRLDDLVFGLAAELDAPLVVTGGGGYRAASVARTLARAGRALAGVPRPPLTSPLPQRWSRAFAEVFRETSPERWGDPPSLAPSPWTPGREERLVRELEAALGRRFPAPAQRPGGRGEPS